ncbi:thiamin pyrophosphokinase 1 isoform X2 [Pseudomyrmex gracilis]|uniref:thiamin pyrophosphokinase 1 isoform X2 n=1 Tax=Pseudomyrmex gracilis TaxID=219809 RepID=UPI000994C1F2|nr:thiamin pyrophosphokinase 1 isoform X2 [Pseudomyrmex gracilis]
MQPESSQRNETSWDPINVFHHGTQCKYAIVVLNCPIYWKHSVLLQLWQNAQITVTVDGGTHRWLRYLEEQEIDLISGEHEQYVPGLITGDLDSCSHALLNKLRNMGSVVVQTPDQDNTDYTKALLQVGHYAKTRNLELDEIYVLAETSGRFDHIIGNINTLYKCDKLVGDIKVIQFARNSLTWILRPGLHKIRIPEILVQQQSWCGLLPFGCPASRITTTGLKWNLSMFLV